MSAREQRPDHPAELTLLDYLMDQLPPETSDNIRRHVAACRACRRTIEDLEDTVVALDRLPTVAIPHDMPAQRHAPRQRRQRRPRRLALVATGLLAVAAAAAAIAVGRQIGRDARAPLAAASADPQWVPIVLAADAKRAHHDLTVALQVAAEDVQVLEIGVPTNPSFVVVASAADKAAVARRLARPIELGAPPGRSYRIEIATTPGSPRP